MCTLAAPLAFLPLPRTCFLPKPVTEARPAGCQGQDVGRVAADRVMESRKVTNKQTAPPGHSFAECFLNVQGLVYFFDDCPEPTPCLFLPNGRLDGATVLWVWLAQS